MSNDHNMGMTDLINDFDASLDAFINKKKALKRHLEALKETHANEMIAITESAPTQEKRVWLASLIYLTDNNIPAKILLKAIGAPENARQFPRFGVPIQFHSMCQRCAREIIFEISTRSSISYTVHGRFNAVKDNVPIHCKECEITIEQEKRQRLLAHMQTQTQSTSLVKQLKEMPYPEYLKTDHWQSTRKRALKRASFKCELCNSNGTLHVHHKTYERRGKEYNADLIVLCADCHAKFHDKIED